MKCLAALPAWDSTAYEHSTDLLVIAPHPDDETLGAGGFIASQCSMGADVRVVAVTDGEKAYGEEPGQAEVRVLEQERALARLGVRPANITRLHLPDSDVASHEQQLVELLMPLQLKAEKHGQKVIPGLENPFGIQLEERFFQDIKKHHVAIPRRLWMQLQGQKGGPQLQDLLTFFVYRCYCAQSETVIPWAGLREQFPQDDSNPRRFKVQVKKAIAQLRILWPEIRIDVVKEGVWVDRAVLPLLPDDPTKKRIRRLSAIN
jgi:hypothetical protein